MTRLLVDESGMRRSFKVGDGVLTIGSGEQAALRLTSPDVAEEHAELDVQGTRVSLRARPGVMPPKVDGTAISGEVVLAPGARIELGAATIQVEFKGAPGQARAPEPAPERPAPVVRKGAGRSGAKRSRSKSKSRSSAGRSKSSRRSKPRAGKERSPWASLGIFLAVIAAILIFARFVAPAMFGDSKPSFEPLAHYQRARAELDAGRLEQALEELEIVEGGAELNPQMASQVASLRSVIEESIAARELMADNALGTAFFNGELKRFEAEHLQGRPEPPPVRLFLERLAEFERRWPKHPELPWVRRMTARYSANVSLADAPTFADLAFKVKTLTWSDPRDFAAAFEAIDAFTTQASPGDRTQALELRETLVVRRAEWFEQKLRQAREEYDNGERGKSVAWLVRLVLYTGDPAMAAEAAELLVRFQDIDDRLRGYRRAYPDQFERLIEHPTIRDHLAKHPLD